MLHVWESVWKASAAIAGFQQNIEQNLLLVEQNSEQTKSRIRLYVEHYPPVPSSRHLLYSRGAVKYLLVYTKTRDRDNFVTHFFCGVSRIRNVSVAIHGVARVRR